MDPAPNDVVKVAIQAKDQAFLFKLVQSEPLETVMEQVCSECGVAYEKNKFSFQLLSPEVSDHYQFVYITETNRFIIRNGQELRLVFAAPLFAKMIKEKLTVNTPSERLSWALKKAAVCTADVSFCREFFPEGYVLLRALLKELLLPKSLHNNALMIIFNLIRLNYLKELDNVILLQMKVIVISEHHISQEIIESALNILDAIVRSAEETEAILKLFSLDDFAHHIWIRDFPKVQCSTLTLMNTLVLNCSKGKTKNHLLTKMNSKPFKDNIFGNIITSDVNVPSDLAHALYVYQSLILTLHKERYRSLIERELLQSDFEQNLNCLQIRSPEMDATQVSDSQNNLNRKTHDLSVLFNQQIDFSTNFKDSNTNGPDEEAGLMLKSKDTGKTFGEYKYINQLTFDCVRYFYNKYNVNYKIAILSEGNNYSQFLQSCQSAVDMLWAKVLQIGTIPDIGNTGYCPLVFLTSTSFFEEIFSRTIILVHKTKREMKARSTPSDLQKVMNVVQRQLQEAMRSQPPSYEKLDEVLSGLSYNTVRSQWQEEQLEHERNILIHCPAVQQLQQYLIPETVALIKKQRLQFLKKGSEFPVWNSQRNQRVKNKMWFACLTSNEKTIQYHEFDGAIKQLPIQNITSLLTGSRCPHIKHNKSRTTNIELSFSLITEESSLDFIAPTQEVYDHWTDAINILLGNEMKSITMKRDLKCLLEMEVRLRILDTDGLALPTNPPPIPLEPPNYDFCLS